MKKIGLMIALLGSLTLQAQEDLVKARFMSVEKHSIEDVLQCIEVNNPLLKATQQEADARKWENRSGNRLEDPRVSYAHVWGPNHTMGGELIISQSFDFPSLYAGRAKMNRLQQAAIEGQYQSVRQEILMKAQDVCLDIIGAQMVLTLLEIRGRQAEELLEAYELQLSQGDASILEMNKMKLEMLNVQTQLKLARTNLATLMQELQTLNGNRPLDFETADYPLWEWPNDLSELTTEYLTGLPTWQALNHEAEVQQRKLALNRQGWIPKLEIGYKRNAENRQGMNGIIVGFSIPIFENRTKVKAAKAQALSMDYRKEHLRTLTVAEVTKDYEETRTLHETLDDYEEALNAQQSLSVLKEALEGGELSLTEYFTEVALVYQSQTTYIQLKNQYYKGLAKLYRNRL